MLNHRLSALRLGGLRREHKQPDSRRRRGGEAVKLVEHDEEVVVGEEGDEGVEVMVGELVFEREWGRDRDTGAEVGDEGREGGGGERVEGDDSVVAAGVAEGLGAGAGDYVAAIAAHYTELRPWWIHGGSLGFVRDLRLAMKRRSYEERKRFSLLVYFTEKRTTEVKESGGNFTPSFLS